ncbi:MAG: hypothetical protein HY268_28095 [Deltaproteobacteria bacterium]|nr:hypothetical protein [Deltaproteobacteria bacterium]
MSNNGKQNGCGNARKSFSALSFRRLNVRWAAIASGQDQSLQHISELAEILLKEVQKFNLVEWVLEINEDVLGTYHYKKPPHKTGQLLFIAEESKEKWINLYWGVIGLIAQLLDVAVEDLTTVVLTHELAYAYTHLGADIDGHRWTAHNFASTDNCLKEGLAQYYTELVCTRLLRQAPQSLDAYKRLLEHQPLDYQVHHRWLEEFKPEEVRFAMIETRRNGPGRHDAFEAALTHTYEKLRKNNRR